MPRFPLALLTSLDLSGTAYFKEEGTLLCCGPAERGPSMGRSRQRLASGSEESQAEASGGRGEAPRCVQAFTSA